MFKFFPKKEPEPKVVKFFVEFAEDSLRKFFEPDEQIALDSEFFKSMYLPRKGDHLKLGRRLAFVDYRKASDPFVCVPTIAVIQLNSACLVDHVWHRAYSPYGPQSTPDDENYPTVTVLLPEDAQLVFKANKNRYHKTKD